MNVKHLRILGIEDFPASLNLLGLALQDEYSIQIASSGAEGLNLAHETPPDLILLDIMLPQINGYETYRRIRTDALLKDIPIVFIAEPLAEDLEARGLMLGAADYLTKPLNIEIARLRIRNLLERERLRRELKNTERQLRLAASVFDYIHDGVIITDAENHIIEVNTAFTQISGYTREEVLGKNPRFLKSGQQPVQFYKLLWQTLLKEGHWSGELWNRHKNGEVYAALTSISVVLDDQHRIHHFIGLFADITQLKNHEFALEHIAHFDALTGVPNRVLLKDRLEQAMAHARRTGNRMAVCYLDLDGFKPVNDRCGHCVGDELLKQIALRIRDCLRAGDTVARVGGDEFVLLLLDIVDLKECEVVLERMLRKVEESTCVHGYCLTVSASMGFTLFPDDAVDAETLMLHADQAMYVAKQQGKNRYQFFDSRNDPALPVFKTS